MRAVVALALASCNQLFGSHLADFPIAAYPTVSPDGTTLWATVNGTLYGPQ